MSSSTNMSERRWAALPDQLAFGGMLDWSRPVAGMWIPADRISVGQASWVCGSLGEL